jgi:enoyl-CoA hydratase
VNPEGVSIEKRGALAILRLDKARGNAIDEPMAEALAAAAREVASDDGVRGVMLTSAHPKLFCPGLDLVTLVEYDRPAMERFWSRFEEASFALFALRKPLVAAIGGAAVAGGCILALTADLRLLRRGSAIGLNEVRIGVPLPWWVVTLLRTSVFPAAHTRVALLGLNFADEEARHAGLVHEVLPADGFEAAALARLEELASRDPVALGTTKAWLLDPRQGRVAHPAGLRPLSPPDGANAARARRRRSR